MVHGESSRRVVRICPAELRDHVFGAGHQGLRLQGLPDPQAAKKATAEAHPLGHMGEPDDIGWACVYLASDEAKFVTGAQIVVDGGYTCR